MFARNDDDTTPGESSSDEDCFADIEDIIESEVEEMEDTEQYTLNGATQLQDFRVATKQKGPP